MTKYSSELKLQAVRAYLEGKESYREIANKFNLTPTPLKYWVYLYREHGEQGLTSSYTNYDIHFKMDVLNYMNDTGASATQTAARFKIPNPTVILEWKRLVQERGVNALIPKKKGRPNMKKEPKKPSPSEGSLEALQVENERLRMENAYLKKLQALIQEKEKSPNRTRRK